MLENKTKKTTHKIPTKPKINSVVNLIQKNSVLISIILVAISASALMSTFYFWRQSNTLEIVDSPTRGQEEVKKLIAEISQFMILPDDEEPTVATVSDPSKLKDQTFFAKAKKGDKVLIYTKAGKAILYDPVNKKIVDVTPINIGNIQETPTPTPISTP